jgi:hypothetical protein
MRATTLNGEQQDREFGSLSDITERKLAETQFKLEAGAAFPRVNPCPGA